MKSLLKSLLLQILCAGLLVGAFIAVYLAFPVAKAAVTYGDDAVEGMLVEETVSRLQDAAGQIIDSE